MSRRTRRAVKKYGLTALCITLILFAVILVAIAVRALGDKGDETMGNTDTDTQSQTSVSNTDPVTDTESNITSSEPEPDPEPKFDFTAWNLILLNPDNKMPEGQTPELKKFSFNGTSGRVDVRVYDAFEAMFSAAKEDGVTLTVRSAYRPVDEQTLYFNNKVQEYKDKGYSDDEAYKKAATIIAVPGTSEHHSGLAMDILTPSYNRLNEGFEKTEAAQWLFEHCADYGFILRYPKDKTDVTEIIYEPWHYRYVGVEAAKIITEEGLCFEEFVAKYGAE